MGLDNARKIRKDVIDERRRIYAAKHNIRKAERNLDFIEHKVKIHHIKKIEYKSHQSNTLTYIGLALVLLTLIVLSFVTLDTIVIETKTTTIRPVVNNHYTTQIINRTYVNIKAEHEMVCLNIDNSEEMKCYKNVFQ